MFYSINDVETSGRSRWHHDVVSLGSVILDENLNVVDRFYGECSPWNPDTFDYDTVEIHGLSLAYLMNQQSSYDLCVEWMYFLNHYRVKEKIVYMPFIYHALNRFDFHFVYNMFLKNDLNFSFQKLFHREHSFSTIKMAREIGITNNGLDVWASDRVMEPFDHHNSLSDALLTGKVFKWLMMNGATMESGFEIKKSDKIDDGEEDQDANAHKRKKKKTNNESNLAMIF